MEGPQATKYNPVVEALTALDDLGQMVEKTQSLEQLIQVRCAQAVGWSLLASVTGGQSINVGSTEGAEQPNSLEGAAKAAFGG